MDLETEEGVYSTAQLLVQKHTSVLVWLCEWVSKIVPLVSPRLDQSPVQLSVSLGKEDVAQWKRIRNLYSGKYQISI